MSNYLAKTKHPETGEWKWAEWIDDHFSQHEYGVRFIDETIVYPPTNLEVKEGETCPADILEKLGLHTKEMTGEREEALTRQDVIDKLIDRWMCSNDRIFSDQKKFMEESLNQAYMEGYIAGCELMKKSKS